MRWFVLQGRLATFFMNHHFYLKEQQIHKLWLFRLWYVAGIFLEDEPSEPVASRETIDSICCQNNILQQIEYRSIYEKPAVFY